MTKKIDKINFKESIKLQLEIIDLQTLVTNNHEQLVKPHRTNFYHLFVLTDCKAIHKIDFEAVSLKPRSILCFAKDRVHQFDKSLNYHGKIIVFTETFFGSSDKDLKFLNNSILFNDIVNTPGFAVSEKTFTSILEFSNQLEQELKHSYDKQHVSLLKNLLHNILLLAEREKEKKSIAEVNKNEDYNHTLFFKNLIDKYFVTLKTVSEYAKKMHISEKRLAKATHTVLDKTPKEIIVEKVLLEAKRLLIHETKSIKEIAFDIGFEEPTNFIKFFKKHTSKTPLEFKEESLS